MISSGHETSSGKAILEDAVMFPPALHQRMSLDKKLLGETGGRGYGEENNDYDWEGRIRLTSLGPRWFTIYNSLLRNCNHFAELAANAVLKNVESANHILDSGGLRAAASG